MSIIESLKLGIQPTDYRELIDEAVTNINTAVDNPLRIRGINDPAYLLLGTYLYLAQLTLEQFNNLTALLALQMIEASGTEQLEAAKAKGIVTIEAETQFVAANSTLSSPEGVSYTQVTPPILVPANTATQIEYECNLVGSVGNSGVVGELLADGWFSSLPVFSVETSTGFLGGRELETEDNLIERGLRSLSRKSTPISTDDWLQFVSTELATSDNTTNPVTIPEVTWEITNLPASLVSCPNQVTRPLTRLYVARTPESTAEEADINLLTTQLEALRLIHTRVEFQPLPLVPVYAKVIISLSTRPSQSTSLLSSVVGIFKAELASAPTFLQQRKLMTAVSRLEAVEVCEEVWLGNGVQVSEPEPLTASSLKPDNLRLGLNLGKLTSLELTLISSNYSETLFYQQVL